MFQSTSNKGIFLSTVAVVWAILILLMREFNANSFVLTVVGK
ncbi:MULTISPECIES: hypothetical protein [Psychrobacillus]